MKKHMVEILELTSLGLANKEIGAKLNLSPRTIESHKLHLFELLGAKSSAHLVRIAIEENLIEVKRNYNSTIY
jgi:two-component system, LuxR family, response regulator FixJ